MIEISKLLDQGSVNQSVLVLIAPSARAPYQIPSPQALAFIHSELQPQVVLAVRSFLEAERASLLPSSETAAFHARTAASRIDAIFHFNIVLPERAADQILIANIDTHDQFFGIERIAGSTAPAVVRSILEAKARYHDAVRLAYRDDERQLYAGIDTGLSAALAHLAGDIPARMTAPDRPEPGRSTEAPEQRWVLGHQIFAAITQCIIIAFNSFETAMLAGHAEAAGKALDLAATLLLSSASAFRFTADFSPDDYSETVRPSMGPEHVGRGFSGLLSEDHRVLVDLMVRTRPLMATAAAALPEQHRRVSDALSYVYEDHKFVCARFGGAEGSSLRSDACSEVAGVVLLDRFKKARTRLLVPMRSSR